MNWGRVLDAIEKVWLNRMAYLAAALAAVLSGMAFAQACHIAMGP